MPANPPVQIPVTRGEGAFLAASVLLEPGTSLLRKPENKHGKTNILLGRLTPAGAIASQLPEGVSNLKQIFPGGVQGLSCCRRWCGSRTHCRAGTVGSPCGDVAGGLPPPALSVPSSAGTRAPRGSASPGTEQLRVVFVWPCSGQGRRMPVAGRAQLPHHCRLCWG